MSKEKRKVLIALGGNALEPAQGDPTAQGQLETVKQAVVHIADLVEQGNDVVITHGNGPQVGRILLQSEAGKDVTPQLPLDLAGAMTQGSIGYHIQNALEEELANRNIKKNVVSLVTQVEVDKNDPAFENPTKPIGPFYTEDEAKKLEKDKGFVFTEDSGRGWRRVVPSPMPKKIVEWESAATLVNAGTVVVVAGGGGIPVSKEGNSYKGVEAVIDKDLSSALLADQMNIDDLFILTAVPKIALNFGKTNEKFLDIMNTEEADKYCDEGHFAPGSMLPKVEASVGFVKNHKNRRAIITSLEEATKAFVGESGTIIVD